MCTPPLWPKRISLDEQTSAFARDVIEDLSQHPKKLSPKYFYDAAGSELFEQITRAAGILSDPHRAWDPARARRRDRDHHPARRGAGRIRRRRDHQGPPAARPLQVRGLCARRHFRRLPQGAGRRACAGISRRSASIRWRPISPRRSRCPTRSPAMPKVGFFPGSTLGNFEPHEAQRLPAQRPRDSRHGAQMIIGVDLEKDERVLYDAYNDAAGVTARFNLNVLVRINRELGGNFDLSAFTHRAIYNRERHRIEMHLISRKAQTVRMLGRSFSFRPAKASTPRAATNTASTVLRRWRAARAGTVRDHGPTRRGCSRFTRWWRWMRSGASGAGLKRLCLLRLRPQRHRLPDCDHDHDHGRRDRQPGAVRDVAANHHSTQ